VVAFIVRAEARTYLSNNDNSSSKCHRNGHRHRNNKKQIPFGDDNKKGTKKKDKGNCVLHSAFK